MSGWRDLHVLRVRQGRRSGLRGVRRLQGRIEGRLEIWGEARPWVERLVDFSHAEPDVAFQVVDNQGAVLIVLQRGRVQEVDTPHHEHMRGSVQALIVESIKHRADAKSLERLRSDAERKSTSSSYFPRPEDFFGDPFEDLLNEQLDRADKERSGAFASPSVKLP